VLYRTLVHAYPEAGLGISIATDSTIFHSDVLATSHSCVSGRQTRTWGDRAVLVLVAIRLGLDGVNPIYYDSVKVSALRICGIVTDFKGCVYISTISWFGRWTTFE
jgi:hypothetical protein